MIESGNALFAMMFGSMKNIQGTVTAQPNIFDGVDYVTSTGQYLGSVNEGILGLDLVGSGGETIGHASENIFGGLNVDLTGGESIVGMPGVLGDNYYIGGEHLGYETANIFGSTDFVGDGGIHLASGTEGALGAQFHLADSFQAMPEFDFVSDISLNSFDAVNGAFDAGSSVSDAMDAMDALGSLDLLAGLF